MTNQFERIASGYYLEGLAINDRDIWFSDVVGGGVHRLRSDGELTVYDSDRKWIGGLAIGEDGSVLATGGGGIRRIDPQTGISTWFLSAIDGRPINGINELAVDSSGNVYFGTCDLDSIAIGAKPAASSLFRFSADGTLSQQYREIGFANGMVLSTDGKTLFCNASFDGTYAYDVGVDGSLSGRRKILEKPDCDGIALDSEGHLWITGFSSGHIERIAANGSILSPFETPAEAITQCRFGGRDLRDLYLVCVPLEAGAALAAGRSFQEKASYLLRTRVDVAGVSQNQVAVSKPGKG